MPAPHCCSPRYTHLCCEPPALRFCLRFPAQSPGSGGIPHCSSCCLLPPSSAGRDGSPCPVLSVSLLGCLLLASRPEGLRIKASQNSEHAVLSPPNASWSCRPPCDIHWLRPTRLPGVSGHKNLCRTQSEAVNSRMETCLMLETWQCDTPSSLHLCFKSPGEGLGGSVERDNTQHHSVHMAQSSHFSAHSS